MLKLLGGDRQVCSSGEVNLSYNTNLNKIQYALYVFRVQNLNSNFWTKKLGKMDVHISIDIDGP